MFNLILQWPIHCYYEGILYSVSHNELEATILQQLRSGKDRQTEAAVSSEAVLFSPQGKILYSLYTLWTWSQGVWIYPSNHNMHFEANALYV